MNQERREGNMLTLMKKTENQSRGFSLVELMIVMAIIGILVAVTIPAYQNHVRKVKVSGAKANLGEIKILQEAYRAENNTYLNCAATPPTLPTGSAVAWAGGGIAAFTTLKFTPSGEVFFRYEVTGASATAFTATASADLDGNGVAGTYTITHNGTVSGPVPANEY